MSQFLGELVIKAICAYAIHVSERLAACYECLAFQHLSSSSCSSTHYPASSIPIQYRQAKISLTSRQSHKPLFCPRKQSRHANFLSFPALRVGLHPKQIILHVWSQIYADSKLPIPFWRQLFNQIMIMLISHLPMIQACPRSTYHEIFKYAH